MKCEEMTPCLESRRMGILFKCPLFPLFNFTTSTWGELIIATKYVSIMSVPGEQRSGGDTFCGFVWMCVL